MELKTQPNEKRCWRTTQVHMLGLKPCCPISGNPLGTSYIEIEYEPKEFHLEVAALRDYVDSYVNGRGSIRSMEGMIQNIATDCANAVQVVVRVSANLKINPGQQMTLRCTGRP